MPRHSGHMIRFILLLLCLGTAGLSPVFAEEGAAPADYDKQERTGTLAVGRDDTYGQLENSIISFMERHRDVLAFRMQPRFPGESFYWELPACQPWLFHAPWQDQDDPCGMQENPRYILFPVILFPSGTWMAGRFYPKGTEQEMYDVLMPEKGKKKKCVNICIPPQASMGLVWERLSRLAALTESRITLAPYQPEPRKEMHIQRPEHPVNILPALPDPAPQHQKPGGSSASEELPPGKGQTATP